MRFRRYTERIPRPLGNRARHANANGDAIARSDANAYSAPHEGRMPRPLPGPILEGARVSNAAAHTCAAATSFFCYAHTGRYPEYLYSYRYL